MNGERAPGVNRQTAGNLARQPLDGAFGAWLLASVGSLKAPIIPNQPNKFFFTMSITCTCIHFRLRKMSLSLVTLSPLVLSIKGKYKKMQVSRPIMF